MWSVSAALMVSAIVLPSLTLAKPRASAPAAKTAASWREDFSSATLNPNFWVVATGQAPGTIAGVNLGDYDPTHVKIVPDSVGGSYLQLLLTQETAPSGTGTLSHGALIYTRNKYGYGTYEWRMRMSSTADTPDGTGDSVSGSVSAGFVYVNNSQTEIDFEFSADPYSYDTLYMVNWFNRQPRSAPTSDDRTYSTLYPLTVSTDFHDYKFVWQRGKITFYVDGTVQAVHTTNVPSAQAYFMINHWGTDSAGWGGSATTGVPRYFYVDWVQYTPLQ